jgi:hypothetical protein
MPGASSEAMGDAEVVDALAKGIAAGRLTLVALRPQQAKMSPIQGEAAPPEPNPAPEPEPEDTHQVAFEITDQLGELVSGIDYVLKLPDGSTETGTLKGKKIEKKRIKNGIYELVLKMVTDAGWGGGAARADAPIALRARTPGFKPGAPGKFQIHDASALAEAPLVTIDAKVGEAEALEAEWTPTAATLEKVKSGQLQFVAKIGPARAFSPPIPAQVKHTIELQGPDGPLADTPVVAHFSGGTTAIATSSGGKAEVWANVGEALRWIDLPEHGGATITVEEGGT